MTIALTTLVLMSTLAVSEQGDWILQPAQERVAERMVGMERPEILPGITLERVALVRDHVQVFLRTASGSIQARFHAPGEDQIAGHKTEWGVLWLPEGSPPGLADALVSRIRSSPSRLRWKSLVAETDPGVTSARVALLKRRVAWRLGLDEDAPEPVPLDPRVQALWSLVRGGQPAQARAGSGVAITESYPPAGSVSVWLATGPARPAPCEGDDVCPIQELLHDLEEERADPQWAARWAGEPRVLVLGATNAADRGEPTLAAALLWQALASPIPDQGAVDLAARWGWGPGRMLEQGLPPGPEEVIPSGDTGALPWLLMVALLLWLGALWLGRDHLTLPPLLLCALGAICAVGTGISLSSPAGGVAPTVPTLASSWMDLGRGTGCALSPPSLLSEGWHAQIRCGRDVAGVVIRSTPTERVHVSTEHHHVQVIPMATTGELGEGIERWLRRVRRELISLETEGERLSSLRGDDGAGRRGSIMSRIATSSRPDQHLLTGSVAMVALFCLLWLLVLGVRAIEEVTRDVPWERRALVGLGAIALVVHLVAPSGMVMVYSGYAQVEELLRWEPLRYGAGANWLYGPWLALLGADHSTVQFTNRLYGLIGLLMLVAWSARLSPRATWAVAGVTVLAPILWRAHGSESILVGGWMMLAATLFSLSEAARTNRVAVGLLGLPCALMAAMTRPEMALALVPLGVVVLAHHRPDWTRRGWTLLALAILVGLVLAYPHAQQVMDTVDALVSVNALPGLERLQSRFLSDMWTLQGLHVALAYGPAALLLLVPLGWTRPGDRVLVTGIFLVSLAWMAFTRVDLPEVSTPRVHAPPWTLIAVVGGLGADALWRRLGTLSSPVMVRGGRSLVALIWLGSALWTLPTLYQTSNADAEEALLRDAQEMLPPGEICLATLDNRDPPPPGKTHRFFPYYLFEDRPVPPRLSNLSGLEEARSACPDGAYALLGMRCYMHLREDGAEGEPPPKDTPIAACQSFRERWSLTPLVERSETNRGDLAFPMYPSGEALTIGLYQVGDAR